MTATVPAWVCRLPVALVLAAAFFAPAAQAANFDVNEAKDGPDIKPGDGLCEAAGGPGVCTLRAAVEEANALLDGGPHLIAVPSGTFQLQGSLGGDLDIAQSMEIVGKSARETTVIGENGVELADRVFDVLPGIDVTLRRMTIESGRANPANGLNGGDIRNAGFLTIEDSKVNDGEADRGGAIANEGGVLTVRRSLIVGSRAPARPEFGQAGAILNLGARTPAVLTIENSTISGNRARSGGGIVSTESVENRVDIHSSTIAFNESGELGGGAGLLIDTGSATVRNTILAENVIVRRVGDPPVPLNCEAGEGVRIETGGWNLESQEDCGFGNDGDQQGVDPLLGSLKDNGGETDTHALPPDSRAIDTGIPAFGCLPTDQRGVERPQGPACDIGAYELTPTDTDPPETAIRSGPSGIVASTSASFTFDADEAGSIFECKLDAGAFTGCSSPQSYTLLSQGAHHFEVRAIDAAGNVDLTPAVRDWTVDTVAPQTTIDSGPSGPTNDATPTFTFSSSEPIGASFQCRVDAQPFAACASPLTTATLADGAHTFEVRAIDAAGNVDASPASRSFTVDTAAPQTTIDTGPSGPTNDSTPTFGFSSSEPGATFQCRVDAQPFAACLSPLTTATLADGLHTFEARAIDAAGNVDSTPASRSVTVDTAAPETTISSGPSGPTNDPTLTFTFTSSEPTGATFQCRVDAQPFAACASPLTTATLTDGPHTFQVRALDAVSNVDTSPASRSFTLDTGPADTTISGGPSGLTNDATPSFELGSNESGVTFKCRVDAQPFADCPASYTSGPLGDGPHTLEAQAVDAVGNLDASPAARSFTVDTRPPETTILAGPAGSTADTTPSFEFSADEPGARFECSLDDGAFVPCSSPFTTPELTVGRHTFLVRAIDPSGNVDLSPASSFDAGAAVNGFEVVPAAPPPPPPPVLGKAFNLEEVSGDVYVSVPGAQASAHARTAQAPPSGYRSPIKGKRFVPLEEARQVPVGSFVDTRFGTAGLTLARERAGRTQTGRFSAGVFQVLQSRARKAKGLTDLRLKGSSFDRCRTRRVKRSSATAGAAKLSKKTIRSLRGNAKGNFRTGGRHSAATVRGTIWITADRCDGTLTTVKRGKVSVRDFRRKRTITLRAGKSYLARAPG